MGQISSQITSVTSLFADTGVLLDQVGFVAKVEIMILISLIFDKPVCIMFEFW